MHEGHHGILDKKKPQKGTAHDHAHHDHSHSQQEKHIKLMKMLAGGIVAVMVLVFVIWKLM
ncbi:MAG: hypothetical protein FD169_1033 [Bacillota bacterium]|nr:MAG: hypothetical protein FD169_1033 [Bacillota bacterium]MBS3949924.1 hypothetical protein [Peptococcaceae bacterium]